MKVVNIYKRIISVLVAFAVASLFVFPFIAHADELDILMSVFAYEDEFRRRMIDVTRSVNDALNDSDLSDETKTKLRAVLACQELALRTMPDIYGNPIDPILPDSDTVTFSGSGSSGIYTSAIDEQLHSAVVYRSNLSAPRNVGSSFRYHVCSSDEFDVYYSFTLGDSSEDMLVRNAPNENGEFRGDYQIYSPYSGSDSIMTFTDSKGYFTNTGSWTVRFYNSGYYLSEYAYTLSNSSSVRVGRDWLEPYSTGVSWCVGSRGVSVTIPDASVPTATPWDYYNDTLLPYMHENYPEVTNNYYVFPNGYGGPTEDPTEPPLFPVTQPWQPAFITPQTETSVSIINPIATDNSGSTYTETTIVTVPVTESSSSYNPVYGFNVPLLPGLETVTGVTLPAETVSNETAHKITDLWSFIKWILDESGLFPIFLAFVSVGFILFILRFLGG